MGARKNASVDEVVIEYAYEMFADNGVDGTSLSDIAKACGISKGTLYYYYPNKDLLVYICAEKCVRNIGDLIFAWMDAISLDAKVDSACESLASVFASDSVDIRLLIALFTSENDIIHETLSTALEEWRVMIEVGALRLPRTASERLICLSSAAISMLLGFALTGVSADVAKRNLLDMLD